MSKDSSDTHNNINIIMNTQSDIRKTIHSLHQQIDNLNQVLKENDKVLWNICSHEWVRDIDYSYDDNIKYRCSKCHLWRHPARYS